MDQRLVWEGCLDLGVRSLRIIKVVEIKELEVEQVDYFVVPLWELPEVPAQEGQTIVKQEERFCLLLLLLTILDVVLVQVLYYLHLNERADQKPVRYMIPKVLLRHLFKCLSVQLQHVEDDQSDSFALFFYVFSNE